MNYLVKENAKLYDATAGNRTLWITKEDPRIIWGDIELDLSFKPDAYIDFTNTGFPDKSKRVIFFDPPHGIGQHKNDSIFTISNIDVWNKKYPKYRKQGHPRYYGTDKCQNKQELYELISRAGLEFYRILEDDGILFCKWSESGLSSDGFLKLLPNFKLMLQIPIASIHENAKRGYWFLMMKSLMDVQSRLNL